MLSMKKLFRFGFCSAWFVSLGLSLLREKFNFKHFVMAVGDRGTCQLFDSLEEWQFSKSKLMELPLDKEKDNRIRRQNRGCLFSEVFPTPLKLPTLVGYSRDVLINILNFDPSITRKQEFADFIAGNKILNSSIPLAHRYGGHQFGYWASQLGDGRAILLGEYISSAGDRWELQLKGSGKTPYSRDGDGRAVLRSSIREFLCSEAMFFLGIPTSRAAALVVGDERVLRDPMYDGNPLMEKVAVVLRVAQSWFRLGSFELLSMNNEIDLLKKLLDFILKEHFPEIDVSAEDKVMKFLTRVSRLVSNTVIQWQAVGFTHGVLNTDNMSVLGITIDYGPFGFVEAYNPEYVPNASDHEARYSYIKQPDVIIYNLLKLSQALSPLLSETDMEPLSAMLSAEAKYLDEALQKVFSEKLGFSNSEPELVMLFLIMLEETKSDFTMSFRDLSEIKLQQINKPCPKTHWALAILAGHSKFSQFTALYIDKITKSGVSEQDRQKQMCNRNPRYVLRNWMAQAAIKEAEENNFIEIERLLRILSAPFTKQEEAEEMGYARPPPHWASNLRLSCSS